MAFEKIVGLFKQGQEGNGLEPVPHPEPLSIATPPGLASILIPCVGMLEYTKLLVPSLLQHTRAPFELIFLDIGSLDGTAEYLAGLKAGCPCRVEVCWTPTDLGIARVCQEAIAGAAGEYLVLLNNDTVVTPYWLNHLVSLATSSVGIGMVGPMSNYAAAGQLVETVPYRIGPKKGTRFQAIPAPSAPLVDVAAVHKFARELSDRQRGKWSAIERLGGFCLLLKRQVLERIGRQLDDWTDLRLFDTDILSTKACAAGYNLAVCADCFVHHFGTRTFAQGAPAEKATP